MEVMDGARGGSDPWAKSRQTRYPPYMSSGYSAVVPLLGCPIFYPECQGSDVPIYSVFFLRSIFPHSIAGSRTNKQ